MSLPKPDEHTIRELDSLFFKFIWNNTKDRVKRDVTIKSYKFGGLKMLKIDPFIDALKISWIRRLILKDSKCTYLLYHSYPNIRNFQTFGAEYLKSQIRTIDNCFWKETLLAWIKFSKKLNLSTCNDFLKEPIWFNDLLKVGGKSFFYTKWFEKGLFFY